VIPSKRLKHWIPNFFFITGFLIICLNISGLLVSLRPKGYKKLSNTIFSEVIKTENESPMAFWNRALYIVYDNMIFCNINENDIKTYRLRIPAWENWILFLLQTIKREYKIYEFISYEKALERGSGLCSQFSLCYAAILNNAGFDAKILPLGDHVVVYVSKTEPQGIEIIADPYFNTLIPYSYRDVKGNPSLIDDHYEGNASLKCIEQLRNSYMNSPYQPVSIKDYVGWKSYYFEPISYMLKWLIPVALMLPLAFLEIRTKTIRSISV